MVKNIREILSSRPVTLSISIVMLLMSVVFFANVLELRGDTSSAEKEVRSTIAESLAIQLTLLATHGDNEGVKQALLNSVKRHERLTAAALVDSTGKQIAHFGNEKELEDVGSKSTLTHISVPIFSKNDKWGDVRAVFTAPNTHWYELRYYLFILFGSLVMSLLFLRKVLVQLDPGKVVPKRVSSAFNMFSDSVIILNNKLQILAVNEAAEEVINKTSDQLMGKPLDDWPWQRDDIWQAPWQQALASGINVSDVPLTLILDGQARTLITSCSVVGDVDKNNTGVLVTLNDMTAIETKNHELASMLDQLKLSEQSILKKNVELETLATRDSLTGLFNRRAFLEQLETDYHEAIENDTPLCILMTDIDLFKKVNDTYGHRVGDEVICAVSSALEKNAADTDTVGRYGGEEFVVAFPGKTIEQAKASTENIRLQIMEIKDTISVDIPSITSSFGIALLTPDTKNIMDLLEKADQALYYAKQSGRNKAIVFSDNVQHINDVAETPKELASPGSAVLSRVIELEKKANEQERHLDTLKSHDRLTGIPNRNLFMQYVETELVRAKRAGTRLGVLSIELREFDTVVSTFGHEAADELTLTFVSKLQTVFRSTDLTAVVNDDGLMSRLTSNEYGVLLTDLDATKEALPVLARLRRVMSEAFAVDGQKIFLGVTVGISLHQKSSDTPEALVESASSARVAAREQSGKFTYVFASNALDKQSREYIELETALHEAVATDAFEIVYQPKLCLKSHTIQGIEALLRWNHPEKGYVPPDHFIRIAESCGLIHDISAFVLKNALLQLHVWRDAGWKDLKMSINISALQLRQKHIALEIMAALRKADVPAGVLELEITETSIIESPTSAIVVLNELRSAGITISMDDFGTGYTSLALLSDLPLDCVKIDRSFISQITISKRSRSIVESIISMSRALDLRVVGEGIETKEQLAVLGHLGCDEIQGYYISKPISADKIPEFLEQYEKPDNDRKTA
ncbi:MAG: EAL domain-containing protein [Granulosicoccaceae bacterium]